MNIGQAKFYRKICDLPIGKNGSVVGLLRRRVRFSGTVDSRAIRASADGFFRSALQRVFCLQDEDDGCAERADDLK